MQINQKVLISLKIIVDEKLLRIKFYIWNHPQKLQNSILFFSSTKFTRVFSLVKTGHLSIILDFGVFENELKYFIGFGWRCHRASRRHQEWVGSLHRQHQIFPYNDGVWVIGRYYMALSNFFPIKACAQFSFNLFSSNLISSKDFGQSISSNPVKLG